MIDPRPVLGRALLCAMLAALPAALDAADGAVPASAPVPVASIPAGGSSRFT